MLLLIDGEYIMQIVANLFANCFQILNTPLFTLAGKNVTLWNVCLSLIMLQVFRDFLDIVGVWGYSEDDFEFDGRD